MGIESRERERSKRCERVEKMRKRERNNVTKYAETQQKERQRELEEANVKRRISIEKQR